MPDDAPSVGVLEAAAALLLQEPDDRIAALVEEWAGKPVPPPAVLRQDFYDVMCIPQSGRFVPPYAHVLRAARQEGKMWFFPPPRHDGGQEVEARYARLGFDRTRLAVAAPLAAPHLPGDHLGFMFAFSAHVLKLATRVPESDRPLIEGEQRALARLLSQPWLDTYAMLVEDRGGLYLAAVADAVREARATIADM